MTGNSCDRHTGALSLAVQFDVWFSWQEVVINCPRTLCSAMIGHFPKMVQEPPPTSALGCHRGYLSSMPCQLPLTWDVTNYSHTHTHTSASRVRKAQDTCQGLSHFIFLFLLCFFTISLLLSLFLVLFVTRWGQQIRDSHRPLPSSSFIVSPCLFSFSLWCVLTVREATQICIVRTNSRKLNAIVKVNVKW